MSRIIREKSETIKPFFINRKRYIETEGHAKVGVEGRYTIRAIKPGIGVIRELSFPNLLTDIGMDAIASGRQFIRMHLGTGTTPPTVSDSSLAVFGVNVTTNPPSSQRGANSSSPYEAWQRITWTSAVGGATGTWTEIGVSNQNTNGGLRSRALILDNLGNPTSFPVLADEQFQGTYEFRIFPPLADNPETISLSGTPYDTVTRILRAGQVTWAPTLSGTGSAPPLFSASTSFLYSGALAPITDSTPTGSQLSGTSTASTSAYGSGNFYIDSSNRWGSGAGVGTVRTVGFALSCGEFQIEYNPTFVKLTTEEFIHNQRVSWARR